MSPHIILGAQRLHITEIMCFKLLARGSHIQNIRMAPQAPCCCRRLLRLSVQTANRPRQDGDKAAIWQHRDQQAAYESTCTTIFAACPRDEEHCKSSEQTLNVDAPPCLSGDGVYLLYDDCSTTAHRTILPPFQAVDQWYVGIGRRSKSCMTCNRPLL